MSNENYEFVLKRANTRKIGFSKVINDLVDDARVLENKRKKD